MKNTETESINVVREKKGKQSKEDEKRAETEAKIKNDLYAIYEQQMKKNGQGGQNGQYRGRGQGRGNGRGRGRGRGRGGYNPKPKSNPGQSGQTGSSGGGTPRKFVTAAMANVPMYACLKCGSMSHSFKMTDACVYGKTSNLMTSPCRNCHVGAHHSQACIKPKAQAPDPKTQFSQYPQPENSKQVSEEKPEEWSKNELPSLFPQ